jgi:hypothetical protein
LAAVACVGLGAEAKEAYNPDNIDMKIFPDQWNYQKIFNFDAVKHIQKTSLCGTLN